MKVLLIRFSSLGDVVLATAAVEALRQEVPAAQLHVLTKPEFRSVFEGHPGVTGLLAWDPAQGLAALARELRQHGYAWIVDLHANLRTRLLRVLVPGPRWSVYAKGALRRRLAVWLHRPELLAGEPHVVDRYLAALAPLGAAGAGAKPRLYLTDAERRHAEELLRAGGWDGQAPLLGMAPGARWATKAWPPDQWVELLRGVADAGYAVPVLLGGAAETALCRDLLHRAAVHGVGLAGRTTLRETAAVLERCRVLVTNDSAPLHLAGAVGTRVLALFGPTVRGFGFGPLGEGDAVLEAALACRPCSLHGGGHCPQGHHRCLRDLSPEAVTGELVGMLSPAPGGRPCGTGPSPAQPFGGAEWREP